MQKEIYQKLIEIQETHWWYIARREISESFLNQIELPDEAKILEIGCGMGGNFERLSKRGKLYATDFGKDAVEYCKSLDITEDVVQAEFPSNPPFADKKFDLIVLMDVLEHIDNDVGTIDVIKDMLKPGGVLFITVPALMSLWSKHDEVCHHKRRYEKVEFESLFDNAGLSKVRLSYYNFFLFLPVYFAKKAFKSRDKSTNDSQKKLPVILNYILRVIFTSEKYFLKMFNFPIGVSLIGVYRK